MRLQTLFLLLVLCAGPAISQNAAFPLESVAIDGSAVPQPVIMEIAGLRLTAPIDKAGIEQACKRLEDSGIFASASYRYAPGPQKGYAVTLSLSDRTPLSGATIDVPGVDEDEAWQWLSARFRRFDRQVPQVDAAQEYLAGEIEQHLGSRMRGQHLTVRMAADLKTGESTVSFQPEVLPRVQSVAFTGNQAVASSELELVLNKIVANTEYTDRKFAAAIDLNLRPVYEEHGFYRVRFAPSSPQWTDAGVSLTVAITEGERYQLGNVEIAGDDLPIDAMVSAAKFPKGKLANWKQIQGGIWEMERVVKQTGFFEATASPDRSYDDVAHRLDVRIQMNKGPLYHYGAVRITGLSPDLERRARQLWRPKAGDPYDYSYPNDFFQAFSRTVDLRSFRKLNAVTQKGTGDHVVDINLVFESR
jgi:outer membrane translocation and assembly module TamA